jgi:hypothetical protein
LCVPQDPGGLDFRAVQRVWLDAREILNENLQLLPQGIRRKHRPRNDYAGK